MKLGGEIEGQRNIEGDGTLLRRMNIGAKSTTWAEEIAKAKEMIVKRRKSTRSQFASKQWVMEQPLQLTNQCF